MIIQKIPGCTRVLGEEQGYLPLPLRDELVNCSVNGPNTPCMVTHWKPSPEELEALNNGGVIELRILGKCWPPALITAQKSSGFNS